jgi:PPM family protein phosphatase
VPGVLTIGQSEVRTDPGRKRRHNEDSYVFSPPLFAIADGMGGARAGEVASAIAAGALSETAVLDAPGTAAHTVAELVQEANRRVHARASTDAETAGMGTTMTVALVDGASVTFGHVGDSRAYLLRDGRLEQLTDDHSLVAELVRRGELSLSAAEVHPQRSVITRALGTDPDVDVDTFSIAGRDDDLYLICSDGLSDMVDGDRIESILVEQRRDLREAARRLIQEANRAGGDDNITAILFELVAGPADGGPAPGEPDERTREYASAPDDEDTLHPEDRVRAPVDGTMVVPVAAVAAELERRDAEPAGDPETAGSAPAGPEEPEAGLGRRLLALAVIVALVVLIAVLTWWGLAR